MVYKDPFARELQGLTLPKAVTPAPVVAPPVRPPVAPTGVSPTQTDLRAVISQTPQAGYISGFDTTRNFAPVFVPRNTYVPGISLTPNTMTPKSMENTSGYILPNGQPGSTSDADRAFAAAKANADQQAKLKAEELAANPPPTKEATQFQDTLNSLVGNAQEMQSLPDQQLAAEQAGGIPQLNQQKAQIDTQIAQKIAEGQALEASYQKANQEVEGKPITLFSQQGQMAQNYKMYLAEKNALAAETGILQATSLGLRGEIQAAQSTADRAIDLKFQAITAQRETYQTQLNALKPFLTAQEKQQADVQQRRLNEEKAKTEEEKSEQKQIQGLMLDAASQGASSQVLSAISGAKSLLEASKVYSNLTGAVRTSKGTPLPGVPQAPGGTLSPGAQAVSENPALLSSYTATEKGKIITELSGAGYDTSPLGAKPLSDSAIKQISDTQKAIDDLSVLSTAIDKNIGYIGPITGFARLNPWSKANQLQADINRVKQTVGKALEGGVLRKEDEEKYKKILPTMNDTAETVRYKLSQISASIQKDIETYKSLQQSGGRSSDLTAPLTKKGQVSTGATSGGNKFTVSQE